MEFSLPGSCHTILTRRCTSSFGALLSSSHIVYPYASLYYTLAWLPWPGSGYPGLAALACPGLSVPLTPVLNIRHAGMRVIWFHFAFHSCSVSWVEGEHYENIAVPSHNGLSCIFIFGQFYISSGFLANFLLNKQFAPFAAAPQNFLCIWIILKRNMLRVMRRKSDTNIVLAIQISDK